MNYDLIVPLGVAALLALAMGVVILNRRWASRRSVPPAVPAQPNSVNQATHPPTVTSRKTFLHHAGENISHAIAIVWFLVLYSIALISAPVLFSIAQFKTDISSAKQDLGIADVLFIYDRLTEYEKPLADARGRISALHDTIDQSIIMRRSSVGPHEEARDIFYLIANKLGAAFQSFSKTPVNLTDDNKNGDVNNIYIKAYQTRYVIDLSSARPEDLKTIDGLLAELNGQYFEQVNRLRPLIILDREVVGAQKDLATLEVSLQDLRKKQASIHTSKGASIEDTVIYQLVGALAFLHDIPFGRHLLSMPSSLLTLIITIVMGLLGTVLLLTTDLVQRQPHTLAWYIFRPMLGVVAAFAMFMVIQAGVLVVQPVASGERLLSGDLNPYVLALIGIAAGLMSEVAVERIRQISGGVLRGEQITQTTTVKTENSTSADMQGVVTETVAHKETVKVATDKA